MWAVMGWSKILYFLHLPLTSLNISASNLKILGSWVVSWLNSNRCKRVPVDPASITAAKKWHWFFSCKKH
jgi:hypothetical protein